MIRKQVYIDEDLAERLQRAAARTGRAEAEHVRAALRSYLGELATSGDEDPLLAMIRLSDEDTGPADAAEEHDRYLYGDAARA